MQKQKEDVLLLVKHVRYKKVDGSLYVNSSRVAWRNQSSDTFRISARFEDIRVQRISPDQKEKVQLQLLLHNGESFTFQFADPSGRAKQLEMRNSVKVMLQTLLPKFKDKAQSELKQKLHLLESNEEVLTLYKELVVSGILSSDEFWSRPQLFGSSKPPLKDTNTSNQDGKTHQNNSSPEKLPIPLLGDEKTQTIGVPNSLLSDIKPEADGVNGIKYNLNHETIDAIFQTYPTVRKRHMELVPAKLTEAEFWAKFFQSQYFHRDRMQSTKNDIFRDALQTDDRILLDDRRRFKHGKLASILDVGNFSDHDIGQGYGVTDSDQLLDPAADTSSGSLCDTRGQLVRRSNNHSLLILKSLGSSFISNGSGSYFSNHTRYEDPKNATKRILLKDDIYQEELREDHIKSPLALEIAQVQDYLNGPSCSRNEVDSSFVPNDLNIALQNCINSMKSAYGTQLHLPTFNTSNFQLALADISPGGCLLRGKNVYELPYEQNKYSDSSSSVSPGHQKSRIREPIVLNPNQLHNLSLLYSSCSELLRHFWLCFPVTQAHLAEKLDRISESLWKFRSVKLANLKNSDLLNLKTSVSSGDNTNDSKVVQVTGHLESMLDAAQQKHSEWKFRSA